MLHDDTIDPAESLQLRARKPASCESLRPLPLARSARIAIVLGVVFAHLLFLRWIETRHSLARAPLAERRIEIVFLQAERRSPEPPQPRRARADKDASPALPLPAPSSRPLDRTAMRATFVEPESSVIPTPVLPAADAARLYRPDGALDLPRQIADDLDAIDNDTRSFGFQHAGLAQARGFVQRRSPLEYEATRFDEQWVDEKDILTEGLEKAMEKTTVTVRIPIPRAPGSKVVCQISLLAAAGGCGIVNNGEGYVVALDDPATLDEKEAQQCRVWWDEIVAAPTPTALRTARERYEAQCRKPLLERDVPPATANPTGIAEPR